GATGDLPDGHSQPRQDVARSCDPSSIERMNCDLARRARTALTTDPRRLRDLAADRYRVAGALVDDRVIGRPRAPRSDAAHRSDIRRDRRRPVAPFNEDAIRADRDVTRV